MPEEPQLQLFARDTQHWLFPLKCLSSSPGGQTPLMQRRSFLQLSLGALAASALPLPLKAAESAKLREIAAANGLLFGAAVSYAQLNRPELADLLAEQCSILVSENDIKCRATHPEPERYDFARADSFINFAES